MSTRIGVIGDFQAGNPTHEAIATSISHVRDDQTFEVEWVPTYSAVVREDRLTMEFDGLWIAPGSPYRDLEGGCPPSRPLEVTASLCSAPAGDSSTSCWSSPGVSSVSPTHSTPSTTSTRLACS
ncbi:MAG: hypothetical protein WB565_04545 [Acidimicrobiales bacterium]